MKLYLEELHNLSFSDPPSLGKFKTVTSNNEKPLSLKLHSFSFLDTVRANVFPSNVAENTAFLVLNYYSHLTSFSISSLLYHFAQIPPLLVSFNSTATLITKISANSAVRGPNSMRNVQSSIIQ